MDAAVGPVRNERSVNGDRQGDAGDDDSWSRRLPIHGSEVRVDD